MPLEDVLKALGVDPSAVKAEDVSPEMMGRAARLAPNLQRGAAAFYRWEQLQYSGMSLPTIELFSQHVELGLRDFSVTEVAQIIKYLDRVESMLPLYRMTLTNYVLRRAAEPPAEPTPQPVQEAEAVEEAHAAQS